MNIFKRAFMWTISFYVISTVAIFYLVTKTEIKNWDIAFVYLQLFLLACSSEICGKRFRRTKVYKLGAMSALAKAISYIMSALIYSHTATGEWYYVCLVVYFVMLVVSVVLTILIVRCEKSYS